MITPALRTISESNSHLIGEEYKYTPHLTKTHKMDMKSILSMVNCKQHTEKAVMSITCDLMAHR